MTDNVLFIRKSNDNISDEEDSDIWDDSMLIKAYDRAVNLAKDEVAKRLSLETSINSPETSSTSVNFQNVKKPVNSNPKRWTVGSPCRAIYSVDGIVYEAIIIKIYNDKKHCMVQFVGYGNVEKILISSLTESEGLQSQLAQQKAAELGNTEMNSEETSNYQQEHKLIGEKMDYDSDASKFHKSTSLLDSPFGIMPPAPPIPPQLMAKLPDNDADALSSMLMSWYVTGFHTGFYQGMKQAQENAERKKHFRK